MYTKEEFGTRLASLRTAADISARELSLTLGQNPSYINRIENHKAYPSMESFFYICEHLNVTPSDFFDEDVAWPQQMDNLVEVLKKLSLRQLKMIEEIADEFNSK